MNTVKEHLHVELRKAEEALEAKVEDTKVISAKHAAMKMEVYHAEKWVNDLKRTLAKLED